MIEVLTNTDRPKKYWSDLKVKLKKEGSELSEKIGQLKMQSADGKFSKFSCEKFCIFVVGLVGLAKQIYVIIYVNRK